ncbi:MAG TPA: prolyl oligopeptidase family serine peptidase [Ktedonobacterales bacterium]|nr:prolyl oligopeptidase family serine peptidase [Ktedonobacterales bacterium]
MAAFFDGTPDEKLQAYASSSPVTYVERVTAPVLIIQGRNDSRRPAAPVEEYARRMEAAGKHIEVHWYETGHLGPLLQVEEGIGHQELMLTFARRVLPQASNSRPGAQSSLGHLLRHLRRRRQPAN